MVPSVPVKALCVLQVLFLFLFSSALPMHFWFTYHIYSMIYTDIETQENILFNVWFSTPKDSEVVFHTCLPCGFVFLPVSYFFPPDVWCKYEQLRSADTSVWENTVKSPCSSPQLCAHAPTHTHINCRPCWSEITLQPISLWREEGSTCAGKLRKTFANISRY